MPSNPTTTVSINSEEAEAIFKAYETLKAAGGPIPVTFEALVRALKKAQK